MSYTIPQNEPTQVRAGETLQFKKNLPDYLPSDGWSITYNFKSSRPQQFSFTTTTSGQEHLADVAFDDTIDWLPDIYFGVGIVSDGTTKRQVWAGKLTVLPALTSDETSDPRSQVRRTFDNVCAVLEGRADSSILKSVVDGTTLERTPIADLLKLRDYYGSLVAAEDAKEQAASGKPVRRNIYVNFVNP